MSSKENGFTPSTETYNPRYNFDNFIVGPSNKMAYEVCLELAKNPGNIQYGSLYIYGGIGVGKTHLARAIQNEIKKNNNDVKVIYATTERFTNDFIRSIKLNDVPSCKSYYRSADVLIIDDLQDLVGRKRTSELLFKTIRDFRMGGRQIILLADKRPDELADLNEKDISVLEWGLMVEIYQPEYFTAQSIIRYYAEKNRIEDVISEELCDYMISNLNRTPRAYMAAINRLTVYKNQSEEEFSYVDAVKTLADLKDNSSIDVGVKSIMKVVADFYGIPVSRLKSNSRSKEDTLARRVSMYLCKKYTSENLTQIAKAHGRGDASSAYSGCRYIEIKLDEDTYLAKDLKDIIDVLKNP